MNTSNELKIVENEAWTDIYCYKDNYLDIMMSLVNEGYYLLEMKEVKDNTFQAWIGQDYEMLVQMTKDFNWDD